MGSFARTGQCEARPSGSAAPNFRCVVKEWFVFVSFLFGFVTKLVPETSQVNLTWQPTWANHSCGGERS